MSFPTVRITQNQVFMDGVPFPFNLTPYGVTIETEPDGVTVLRVGILVAGVVVEDYFRLAEEPR